LRPRRRQKLKGHTTTGNLNDPFARHNEGKGWPVEAKEKKRKDKLMPNRKVKKKRLKDDRQVFFVGFGCEAERIEPALLQKRTHVRKTRTQRETLTHKRKRRERPASSVINKGLYWGKRWVGVACGAEGGHSPHQEQRK